MIAISPGHWKVGTGAVGLIDEVTEARKVVNRLAEILRQQGVTVQTIVDDVSTNQRENLQYLVKKHNATQRNLDVAIHFNATSGTTERAIGCEVLYVNDQLKAFANKLSTAISEASQLKNRGAKKRKDLYFLNYTKAPAVVIEVCFVNSKADVALYKTHFHTICLYLAATLSQFVKPSDTQVTKLIQTPTRVRHSK